uniref:Uncharacterized protein n=1 Tax=Panagrolaimus sp. PS1159 TaxID=55785 RepID=A0AC35GQA0_9BILA
MEMSEIQENIQFESVEIKTEKSTYSVDPTKPITIVISSTDPKTVYLRILWKFIEMDVTEKMKRSIKSYDSYSNTEKELFNFCQRLTIQKNGNIFIKLKNGLGFIFYWEKSGKFYFKGKICYQMFNLKISEMYNGLEFYDIKLKYEKSTYTMSPGCVTAVEMPETSRLVEINVLWSYKNGYSEENTKCSVFSRIKNFKKSAQNEMDPIEQKEDKNEQKAKELYEKIVPQSTRISPSEPIQETTIPENKEEKVVSLLFL